VSGWCGKLLLVMESKEVVTTSEAGPLSWREQAVARSLDSARLRAEGRVQRFLDAAIELLSTGSSKDFTVQEVVERSGQSLRSFYQYFGGKHELLLALFEESVRSTVEHLREQVSREDLPLERLHRFVVEYYRLCQRVQDRAPGPSVQPLMMAEFAQQLLTTHPKEAARAFVPLVGLFEELLDEAAAAGSIRDDLRRGPTVGVVLEVIMFNAFSSTISGSSVRPDDDGAAEELWKFVVHGIGVSPAS
jgi:AcrR family transcriptional regulator